MPHLDRVRGVIRVHPAALTGEAIALHPDGSHVWRPYAPVADIEVAFDRPGWTWSGSGYFDANFGTRALEADFRTLDLVAAAAGARGGLFLRRGAAGRDGAEHGVALRRPGGVEPVEPPARLRLARSRWALGGRRAAIPEPRRCR